MPQEVLLNIIILASKLYSNRSLLVHTSKLPSHIKFMNSEKATKFCEISTLDLSYVVTVKAKVEISQNFVAFSDCL